MEPKFTLIILAYNDSLSIEKCLDSVKGQDVFSRNIPFEIITVPNGCTDDTEQKIDKFFETNKSFFKGTEVRKISIKDGHRNKALNRGIADAKGGIIMYLNSDCSISPNTLSGIYNAFCLNEKLQVTGVNDIPILDGIEKGSMLYKMFEGELILSKIRNKYLPIGRFLAFRKGFIDTFPEDIHSEDIWLGLKAYGKLGPDGVNVVMDATVYWTPPNDWPSYITLYTRYNNGLTQLFERHPETEAVFKELNKATNTMTTDELVKRVIDELINRGLGEKEAIEYIQKYKTIREIIKENEKMTTSKLIANNGTWLTDR